MFMSQDGRVDWTLSYATQDYALENMWASYKWSMFLQGLVRTIMSEFNYAEPHPPVRPCNESDPHGEMEL